MSCRAIQGKTIMENWLASGQEINGVAANNDEMALGGVAGDQGCRKTRAKYCWGNSVYINFLLWFTSVTPSTPIAVRVYFQAACWKRRFHIKETAVSPDEVMSALRRYLESTGDTERAAALKMGVNQHTLCRWLSDEQSPKKGKMALAAFFLRQAGYL
jgi:hypothetical protein